VAVHIFKCDRHFITWTFHEPCSGVAYLFTHE